MSSEAKRESCLKGCGGSSSSDFVLIRGAALKRLFLPGPIICKLGRRFQGEVQGELDEISWNLG